MIHAVVKDCSKWRPRICDLCELINGFFLTSYFVTKIFLTYCEKKMFYFWNSRSKNIIVDLPVKKEDKLSTKTKPIEIKYIIIGKTPKSMPCSPIRLKSVLIQTKDIIGKTDDKSLDGITELIGVTWLHKIRWHGYTWGSFIYYISTILPTTTFSHIFVQLFSSKCTENSHLQLTEWQFPSKCWIRNSTFWHKNSILKIA